MAHINRFNKVELNSNLKCITPLLAAVMAKNIVAIEELVKAKCDCNYQEEMTQMGAVHFACKFSRVDIFGLLVEHGNANIFLKSKNGITLNSTRLTD